MMAALPRRVGQRCASVAHAQGVLILNLLLTISLFDLGNVCSCLVHLMTGNSAPGDGPGLGCSCNLSRRSASLQVLFCATSAGLAARSSSISFMAHIRTHQKVFFIYFLRCIRLNGMNMLSFYGRPPPVERAIGTTSRTFV